MTDEELRDACLHAAATVVIAVALRLHSVMLLEALGDDDALSARVTNRH
jgi:hypothetical protein